MPRLKSPQSGSVAAAGDGLEGVYFGSEGARAIVGFDHSIRYVGSNGFLIGKLKTSAWSWETDESTMSSFSGVWAADHLTGSFFAFDDLMAYSTPLLHLYYSQANALAVRMSDLQGTWSTPDGVSLTIAPDGSFNGSMSGAESGACTLSGKFVRDDPSSSLKNLFKIEFDVSGDDQCHTSASSTYHGLASVGFVAAGTLDAQGYYRGLNVIADNDDSLVSMFPQKQRALPEAFR